MDYDVINIDDNACNNCGECICFSCAYREYGVSRNIADCNRCDNECEDVPKQKCDNYKYSEY